MLNKKDIKIETTKGTGKGGQRKNKVETMVKATHIPTGITASIDGRNQYSNKQKALKLLEQRVAKYHQDKKDAIKKSNRDRKIHERNIIRTYNYSRGTVKDHRSGKVASIKNVMEKGRLDLLQ